MSWTDDTSILPGKNALYELGEWYIKLGEWYELAEWYIQVGGMVRLAQMTRVEGVGGMVQVGQMV